MRAASHFRRALGLAAVLALAAGGAWAAPIVANPPRVLLPTGPGAPAGGTGTAYTDTAFDNVELADPGMARKLGITRVGSGRTDANLLTVFVGLRNKTAHTLVVEVQTVYKNGAGQVLDGGGSWIPMRLKPHGEAEYRSVAISEAAADFVVHIRRETPAPAKSGSSPS